MSHPKRITLEEIGKIIGVSEDELPRIVQVYEANRHDPTMLFMHSGSLSDAGRAAVFAFIGAIVSGKAVDHLLFQPDID